jgi:hypothetical protein
VFASLRLAGACAFSGLFSGPAGPDARILGDLAERLAGMRIEQGGVLVRPTGRILDATDPLLDLQALARGRGARAGLARLLLEARGEGAPGELPSILERVRALPGAGEAQARDLLVQAARRLLTAADRQERGAR